MGSGAVLPAADASREATSGERVRRPSGGLGRDRNPTMALVKLFDGLGDGEHEQDRGEGVIVTVHNPGCSCRSRSTIWTSSRLLNGLDKKTLTPMASASCSTLCLPLIMMTGVCR